MKKNAVRIAILVLLVVSAVLALGPCLIKEVAYTDKMSGFILFDSSRSIWPFGVNFCGGNSASFEEQNSARSRNRFGYIQGSCSRAYAESGNCKGIRRRKVSYILSFRTRLRPVFPVFCDGYSVRCGHGKSESVKFGHLLDNKLDISLTKGRRFW